MKIDLQLTRNGDALVASVYDVTDADSFANACADLWWKLARQAAATAGAGHCDSRVLAHLAGAQLRLARV